MVNFDDLVDDFTDLDIPKDTDPKEEETPAEDVLENEETSNEEVSTNEKDDDDFDATPHFEVLKELGVFSLPEDFEFDGTVEGIKKATEVTKTSLKETVKQELLESLSDNLKPLLEYGLKGGTDINAFINAYSEVDYDSIDLSDEHNQKYVIYEYFKQTSNYTDEKIGKMIERLEAHGELESEALTTIEELKEIKETKKAELIVNAEKEAAKLAADREAKTKEMQSLIDSSVEFSTERKNRLKTFMFTAVKKNDMYVTGLSDTMNLVTSNPQHLIQLADLLADYNPKTGFDLERLKKKIKTQDNKSLKELLNTKLDPKSQMKGTNKKVESENFDWDGYLNN